MKTLRVSSAFKKDLKRIGRRGVVLSKLEAIVDLLRAGEKLPPSVHAHPLKGVWKTYWDCHIEPDWLLIYRVTDGEIVLARTGTHADLLAVEARCIKCVAFQNGPPLSFPAVPPI